MRRAPARLFDLRDHLVRRRVLGQLSPGQFRVTKHPLQKIIEIVRDAAEETGNQKALRDHGRRASHA